MAPKIENGFDPLHPKHRETMQAVFSDICAALPGVGMCLFLFDEQRVNYISNAKREETLLAIKAWVAKQEVVDEPRST